MDPVLLFAPLASSIVLLAGCVGVFYCRVRHRVEEIQEELGLLRQQQQQQQQRQVLVMPAAPEGYGYRYIPPPPPFPSAPPPAYGTNVV